MTIDEVRAWCVARGGGISAADQLFYERLAGILEPGEVLEGRFLLSCEDALGSAVLTDHRFIHIGSSIMHGMVIREVPRPGIQAAKAGGLFVSNVTVKHAGGSWKLAGSKAETERLRVALAP